MLSSAQFTFDHSTLTYALYVEPLYDGKQKPGTAFNITEGFTVT